MDMKARILKMNGEKAHEEVLKENIDEITYKALLRAKEAFYDYLEGKGYDGAYWDIVFNAFPLTTDLESRMARFTIEYEYKAKEESSGR